MLPERTNFQQLRARFHAVGAGTAGLEALFSTGVPAIDALLGGGVPCGCVLALEGCGSAGCRSLAAALLARATQRGLGAVIDGAGELYPPALEAAGVRLERLLIVPVRTAVGAARAADLLLRSRTARVVVMTAIVLRAAIWVRLASLAHKAGAILIVVATRAAAELRAVAAVRRGCRRGAPRVDGTQGLGGTFAGFEVRAEVRKHRR